jgi:hypothetical protein
MTSHYEEDIIDKPKCLAEKKRLFSIAAQALVFDMLGWKSRN